MIRQAQEVERRSLIEAVKRFNEATISSSASWLPQLGLELAFVELLSDQALNNPAPPGLSQDANQSGPRPEAAEGSNKPQKLDQEAEHPDLETEVKPSLTETKPEQSKKDNQGSALTLNQMVERWPKLRELLAQKSPTLLKRLASGKPLAVEGTELILGFDYDILKGKFDNEKNARAIIEDILSSLLNHRVTLRTVVTANYKPRQKTAVNREEFVALARELGGVVQEQE